MNINKDKNIDNKDLLRNKKVVEEINRHLWIESEKAGYDIGFEQAAVDWLENFSKAWMNYHMPQKPAKSSGASSKKAAKNSTSKSNSKTK